LERKLTILVLEDEQRAGEKLLGLLVAVCPDADTTWLRSVRESIAYLRDAVILDLVFADIELLDGNVFSLFESVTPPCPIVFCTAYDSFYVDAFRTNGIAYLLKPYTAEQFDEAWNKYLLLFEKEETVTVPESFVDTIRDLLQNEGKRYKTTFPVKRRDGVFLLKCADIAYFQAQGDFVLAIDQTGTKHILSYSLSEIEEATDPDKFFRINRSEIVNGSSILKFAPYYKNRLAITLARPATVLHTSNSRTPQFRSWIEAQ